MKVALTPMEFAQRASRLYAKREAVIDGDLRYTYEEFLARCDRCSACLQRMGIKSGDRVAYIAPNTHAQLESFYAVPQIGAVLVPINYRLTAEDFAYIVSHSGARILCAHGDYLDAVDGVRAQLS
jgi:fatty-acyl-CoA synthase